MPRSKKQNKQRNQARVPDMIIPRPPPLNALPIRHNGAFRFITNAAVADLGISFQNLLDLVLLTTSAIAAFDLFLVVRIRRIRMWAAAVVGNATTVSLAYTGGTAGAIGDQRIHTDTSMGIEPAYLSVRPAGKSLLANFQESSTAQAFQLSCPSGTVIDLDLSFMGLYGAAVAAQNASVGAAV
jgi:hypothetical protein